MTLVERLLSFAADYTTTFYHDALIKEAADRIEELEVKLHELALDWQVQQAKLARYENQEPVAWMIMQVAGDHKGVVPYGVTMDFDDIGITGDYWAGNVPLYTNKIGDTDD